jgi:hypothetical protein
MKDFTFSVNDDAVIYPSESGWKQIVLHTKQYYDVDLETAKEWVEAKKTDDGGYRDQLAHVMCVVGKMFYTGTPHFSSTKIVINHEE